jgi:hypothetical protein
MRGETLKHPHDVIEVMSKYAGLSVCGQPEQALADLSSLHASVMAPFAAHQQIGGRGDALQEPF